LPRPGPGAGGVEALHSPPPAGMVADKCQVSLRDSCGDFGVVSYIAENTVTACAIIVKRGMRRWL
jgi:hypothetical protein